MFTTFLCFYHSLVAGNVNGRLKSLFSKVNNVLKKTGQFDVCKIKNRDNMYICVVFFTWHKDI